MAVPPPCWLEALPLDVLLLILQSSNEGGSVLSLRDLAALLVAAPFAGRPSALLRGSSAVAAVAHARLGVLLGAPALPSPRAPMPTAAERLRLLALAQRIDADVRATGRVGPGTPQLRTTLVAKATGRVQRFGDSQRRTITTRERISACANAGAFSIVCCEPATVYVFGWHDAEDFVWHERVYPATKVALVEADGAAAACAAAPAPAPAPEPLPAPLPVVAAVAGGAAAAAPAAGDDGAPAAESSERALTLEQRVTEHLARVRHFIANRPAAAGLQ